MLSNVTKTLKICKSFREPAQQLLQSTHSCATQTRQMTTLGGLIIVSFNSQDHHFRSRRRHPSVKNVAPLECV